jgi:hypothetical protein
MATIEQEIEELKIELNQREDTHPDYLPIEVRELQNYVIAVHSHLEESLKNRFLAWSKKNLQKAGDASVGIGLPIIHDLLDEVPYSNKVRIIEKFNDTPQELINSLIKRSNCCIKSRTSQINPTSSVRLSSVLISSSFSRRAHSFK